MNQESTSADRKESKQWIRTQWNSNHVNFLLAFVGATILVNMIAVAYQQSRMLTPQTRGSGDYDAIDDANQETPLTAENAITIRVMGAPSLTGIIVIQIADSQSSLDATELAWMTEAVPLANGEAICLLDPEKLPEVFGITAFHDDDGDRQISTSVSGVPLERYGYSGAVRYSEPGVQPIFDEIKIERPSTGSAVDIFIR